MKCFAVSCDTPDCDAAFTGSAWNSLWAQARDIGWRKAVGTSPAIHYCPTCMQDIKQLQRTEKARQHNLASKASSLAAIHEAENLLFLSRSPKKKALARQCVAAAKLSRSVESFFQAKMYALAAIAATSDDLVPITEAITLYHPATEEEDATI